MSALIVLLVFVLVIGLLAGLIYNSLVSKRVICENAWSQIDVQLKRRHDLVPNLVETVKGYAAHESKTLENVIRARNQAISASQSKGIAEQSQAENMLTGALRQLFALSESYPDLKANQNFLALQEEITSTENRVSFARQHFNDSVANYNTSIQQIPGNLVASFGGFKVMEFYELDPVQATAVRDAPRVSF